MKLLVAAVMFAIVSLGTERQAWPLQDRQGTNFAEPQVQPQSQQQPPGNVSPLLNTKPSAGTGQANSDQHDESGRPKGETEYIQYWLVALTFLQAIIIFFQTVYTRRDANAAKESADAAAVSANAALLQAEIMKNRERPWVMVGPTSPEDWPVGGAQSFRFRFKWTVKNVGSSPAFLTRLSVEPGVSFFPPPDRQPMYPDEETFSQFIIPPNGTHDDRMTIDLTVDDIESYLSGRGAIVFYGIIDYHGPFSGPHRTRFYCYWEGRENVKRLSLVGPPKTVEYT